MTKKEEALMSLGFRQDEVGKLRRLSLTLRRWYELQCGTDAGGIDQDDDGTWHWYNARTGRWSSVIVPDRETGARKRLAAIMADHPQLGYHVQTDPRGAALYILRPDDVPEGGDPAIYYSRGVCVY